MVEQPQILSSGVFITFSGNCRKALTFYQTCFGGTLQFESFESELQGYTEMPVVSGSLSADSITIHGSDLVHNEGRRRGNYISIFLQFQTEEDRSLLVEKLNFKKTTNIEKNQSLIEVTDDFDVLWVLAI